MGRNRTLDIIKGLAIWMIAFLHIPGGPVRHAIVIYTWPIPVFLFYLCSGWLLATKPQKPKLKQHARYRLRSLGKTYLYWSLILLAIDLLLFAVGYYDGKIVMRDIFKTLVLRGIGTLWFIPALFFGELFALIMLRTRRVLVSVLEVLLFIGAWCIAAAFYHKNIAHSASDTSRMINAVALVLLCSGEALVGVLSGYALKRVIGDTSDSASKRNATQSLIGVLIFAGSYFALYELIGKPMSREMHELAIIVLRTIACVGVMLMFRVVNNVKSRTLPVGRFLSYWGRNSLSFMVTHYSITMVLADIIIVGIVGDANNDFAFLITILLLIGIQYLFAEVINRRFPHLIGRLSTKRLPTT